MSLSEAIQALRKAVPVPWVPSTQNQREPLEALPAVAVPLVPPVPSEKTKSQARKENPEADGRAGCGLGAKSQNGEVSNSFIQGNLGNLDKPMTDQALAELVTQAAGRFKLSSDDLWAFLSLEDIEAMRTGSPEEIAALWAFAESRGRTGDRTGGGHDLPFPGAGEPSEGSRRVCCGDCGHFLPDRIGDGFGMGRCGRGIEPGGGLMYPGVERYCRDFVPRRCAENEEYRAT